MTSRDATLADTPVTVRIALGRWRTAYAGIVPEPVLIPGILTSGFRTDLS